jgi:hypothetical protein
VRAEATKHVLPGRKSLGCPAAVCAAVGATWEASKIGGLNIKECLQPRKHPRGKVVFADLAGSRPSLSGGRPMTQGKKQAYALCGTAVVGDQASEERFTEITSGRSCWQQGLVATCKDSSNEAKAEGEESQRGLAHESVVARTEGQRPPRRRNQSPRGKDSTSGQGTLDTWRFHRQHGGRTQSRRLTDA